MDWMYVRMCGSMGPWAYASLTCIYVCMYVGMYVCMHACTSPLLPMHTGAAECHLESPLYATQLDPGYKTAPSVTPKSRGKRRAKKKQNPLYVAGGHRNRTCCFLCVCVCVNVYVHVYVYLILYMYVLRYLYIYMCVCVCV